VTARWLPAPLSTPSEAPLLGQPCPRTASAVTSVVEDLEGSEAESEHENATNSDGSFSDDGFPSSAGRVRQETGNSNGAAGPEDPSETAPGLRSQEPADGVSRPATCLTAAAVQERAAAMFVFGAAALSASSLPSPSKATTRASTRRRKDFEPRSRCRCVAHLHPTYHPGGGIADPVCTTARLPLVVLSPISCTPHPFIPAGTTSGPQARAHMCALHVRLTAVVHTIQGRAGECWGSRRQNSAPSVPDLPDSFVATMLESPAASGRVPTCSRRSPDAAPAVLEKNGVPFCIVSWGQGRFRSSSLVF
jgi:hypothetical protein